MEFFVTSLFYIAILSYKKGSFKKDLIVILIAAACVFFLNTYLFYTPFLSLITDILAFESQIPFLLLTTYVILIITPVIVVIKLKLSLPVLLQLGIVLLIAVSFGIKSFDEVNHQMGKIMAAGNKGDYGKVLKIRDKTSINTRLISTYTNMALLKKGTLLSSMFKYRQDGGTDGVYPSRAYDNFTAYINMKICFEIGSINPSIRWAIEASAYMGYNVEILKHLILCHLINDNVAAADKYYAILNKMLFHRALKNDLGLIVRNYKNGNTDKIIIHKRAQRPAGDYYQNNGNKPVNFEWALKTKNNQKALDFYTAVCLTNNEYNRLKDVIPKMFELGYKAIPIHVQEALCLYPIEGLSLPDLFGYEIDKNLYQNCVWFLQRFGQYNDNLFPSDDTRIQGMKDTYWYYLFQISPVTRGSSR
jgi:hypothetical protein